MTRVREVLKEIQAYEPAEISVSISSNLLPAHLVHECVWIDSGRSDLQYWLDVQNPALAHKRHIQIARQGHLNSKSAPY